MMWRGCGVLCMCAWLLVGAAGCVSLADYEKTKQRADTAEKIVADLRRKLDQLEADYERLKAQLRSRPDVAAYEDEIAQLKAQLRKLIESPPVDLSRYSDDTIRVNPDTGGLMLADDVCFDSGKATIKETFKPAIRKVVKQIKAEFPDHYVFIDGHTDRQPIKRSGAENPDNWYLGLRRAHAIMTFLRDDPECRFDQERLVITSPGYIQPVKGEEGKIDSAKNRRVELRVVKDLVRAQRAGQPRRAAAPEPAAPPESDSSGK